MTLQEQINGLEEELKTLVLPSFTIGQAVELGMWMYEKAKKENKVIAISITKNKRNVFRAALEGTTKNNDDWIRRKENAVYDFEKSSYQLGITMDMKNDTLWNRYGLEQKDYAQAGGCVPVIVKGVGMVGTVTVSGMAQSEDHEFVVEALKTLID